MYENEQFQEGLNEIARYDFASIFINCECLWLRGGEKKQNRSYLQNREEIFI